MINRLPRLCLRFPERWYHDGLEAHVQSQPDRVYEDPCLALLSQVQVQPDPRLYVAFSEDNDDDDDDGDDDGEGVVAATFTGAVGLVEASNVLTAAVE